MYFLSPVYLLLCAVCFLLFSFSVTIIANLISSVINIDFYKDFHFIFSSFLPIPLLSKLPPSLPQILYFAIFCFFCFIHWTVYDTASGCWLGVFPFGSQKFTHSTFLILSWFVYCSVLTVWYSIMHFCINMYELHLCIFLQ